MNTQAHRMAQDLIHDLESLIVQTERNAMLGRKLADDDKYSDNIDHSDILNSLELANRHLKLAKALLSEVDDVARKENPRG
jgi:hypothetical protein